MATPFAASSTYFRIPQFSKGDLEEVMSSMRPYEISEISRSILDAELPLFSFPEKGAEDWSD